MSDKSRELLRDSLQSIRFHLADFSKRYTASEYCASQEVRGLEKLQHEIVEELDAPRPALRQPGESLITCAACGAFMRGHGPEHCGPCAEMLDASDAAEDVLG